MRLIASTVLASIGCGYRPIAEVAPIQRRVRLRSARSLVAVAGLAQEAIFGARAELAEVGALAASTDLATDLDVVVVRFVEEAAGVVAVSGQPRASAVHVVVAVRAEPADVAGTPEIEGDFVVATPADAATWLALRDDAARSAARLAGRRLARALVGLP
ncbi:MAG: hypothetical protein ACHREM_18890 [Polyangiales bacterium]